MEDFQNIIKQKKTFDNKLKRTNAIVIILSLCIIFIISLSVNQLIKQKNQINDQVDELENFKDSILKIRSFNDSLIRELRILTPKNSEERQRLKQLVSRIENSQYSVTLISYGYSASEYGSVWSALAEMGFITHVYVVQEKIPPSWVSKNNTVFYYIDSNKYLAQNLADTLKKITDKNFTVQTGKGYAVAEGQKNSSLIVHLINQTN